MQNGMDELGVWKQSDCAMDADEMCKQNLPTIRKSSEGSYTTYSKNLKPIVHHPLRKPADYVKGLIAIMMGRKFHQLAALPESIGQLTQLQR